MLDQMCSAKETISNSNVVSFGMYKAAIEDGIIQHNHDLSKRVLYCLRWGLQNLR